MLPAVVPLVPGGKLYETMFGMVTGAYASAAQSALTTLKIALGIAGGIMVASAVGLLLRRRKQFGVVVNTSGAPEAVQGVCIDGSGVPNEPPSDPPVA